MKVKKPSFNSLKKLLGQMSKAQVVVAGDLILDSYVWGRVKRISPEAPVPIVDVDDMDFRLGGAANVAAGVAALGAEVKVLGIVGDDMHGRELVSLIEGLGISSGGIVVDEDRPTTLKTRVIAHGQQVVRYDREVCDAPRRSIEKKLTGVLTEAVSKKSILILSDYDKGVFRGGFASKVIKSSDQLGVKVAVDPKVDNIKRFAGAYVITPNHSEAGRIAGFSIISDKDVERACKSLITKLRCENVLITRGKSGMSLCRAGKSTAHVPTIARQVFDVTGAGDTAIAVLAAAIAAGGSIEEAMWLANAAGGVTIGKVGTATVDIHEIEKQLREEYAHL